MQLFFDTLYHAAIMAADPWMLLIILGGVAWGCCAGSMPGMSAVIAIGVMVPFTIGMAPIYAVAFLIAISVGVAFGNSIPAILVGLPGTPSAVMTALDGHALHKRGESGLALGVTYFASVTGQFISAFIFLALVVPLSYLTYVFLSPEMFAVYFLGATAIISLTTNNIIKGLTSAAFGLTVALVGRDALSSVTRFDFGILELRDGMSPVPVIIGLLAISSLLRSMRQTHEWDAETTKFEAKFPPLSTLREVFPFILAGVGIGSFIGAVPGMGGSASAVISYQQSKLWSKHPEEYGKGSIEGIAANESAQNADQSGELIPTFGLGIPGSGGMVVLLGALLMHGFVPGPLLIRDAPQLLYASVAGLFVATIVLALIGWWIARALLKLVTLDRSLVLVGALGMTTIGVFSLERSTLDVALMLGFGVVGYFMSRYGYSTAGAAIGVVLGGGLETNLRAGLLLKDGDVWAFLARPWTIGILAVAAALLVYGIVSTFKLARQEATARRLALQAHLEARKVAEA